MGHVHEEVEPVLETNDDSVMEEPKKEPVTLGKLKELLKEHIPKPNALDSNVRIIKKFKHFKIDDVYVLLSTKEQTIINYIKSNYTIVLQSNPSYTQYIRHT